MAYKSKSMSEYQILEQIFNLKNYTLLIWDKLCPDATHGNLYATKLKVQWKQGKLPKKTAQRLITAFGYDNLIKQS